MGTIALFITVFILLCIFALIFVCYRAGRDSRQQQELQDEEAGAMQRATIVLSIIPGSAAAAAFTAQQPYSSSRSRPSYRKTPTPPTIIRNLPVVIWDKPKAQKHEDSDIKQQKDASDASHASTGSVDGSESKECLCVICCCEYEAGESVKLLPCMHMYHQGCIDAWLERSHVCPVCQADVIRAAGLSAAAGDWSVHTQEAVNVISGVQNHAHTSRVQQQQQQEQAGSIDTQQLLQQVAAPLTPVAEHESQLPTLPVSSPPATLPGTNAAGQGALTGLIPPPPAAATYPLPPLPAAAPVAGAAPSVAAGDSRQLSTGSSAAHSTDAIALVLAGGGAQGWCGNAQGVAGVSGGFRV